MPDNMVDSMPQQPQPPSEQPVFPEGHQQTQQPPYYRPPEPPKRVDTLLISVIVIVVVIATVLPVTLFLLLLPPPTYMEPTCGSGAPTGQIAKASADSNTTATVTFFEFSTDPPPVCLDIILERDIRIGLYEFPSNEDGVELDFIGMNYLGAITYRDFQDNGEINQGDQLLLSGLTPESTYTIEVIWSPNGYLDGLVIDTESFTTPA